MSGPWERYKPAPSGAGPWAKYGQAQGAFEKAVERVLKTEGGYVNDPDDSGGETKYGISQAAYPSLDIKKLTQDDARAIYREDYWNAIKADQLPEDIREAAFDAAVNHGVGWARAALKEVDNQLVPFLERRKQAYEAIVAKNPVKKKYLRGWMNRIDEYMPAGPWNTYKGE